MISPPLPPWPRRPAAVGPLPPAAVEGGTDQLGIFRAHIERLLAAGLPHIFAHMESILIAAALERSRGNQVRAAARLGISRNSLRTLVRRHRLEVVRVPHRQRGATSRGAGARGDPPTS